MKRMRAHPINILENTSRYLILLLLPLLRALLRSGDGFYVWLRGAWFDLCIVGLILALGIYRWYVYQFSFDREGIYIYKGVFFRQNRYLAFQDLTALSVQEPWYYLPIKAVRLNADTDGGSTRSADFTITLRKSIADRIFLTAKRPFTKSDDLKRYYIPGNLYIALFSLLTSNSITGAIYVSTSVSQIGDIFGQDIEDLIVTSFTRLVNLLAFGLPPAAAIVGYVIFGCWFFSFVMNLVKHLRFEAARRGKTLEVSAGLFTRRRITIAVQRINYLLIRQSLLSKLFGFFSVFIQCTGYGKLKNEMSVLMPSGEFGELGANLTMLLPEIPLTKRQIKPKLINLSRFLIPPLAAIGCLLGAGLLALHLFPSFHSTLIFLLVIAEIPAVWWLLVKIFSFFFTGIGTNDDVITIYYTFGYQVLTSSIPRDKISKIEISQTLFQISTHCCDVTFCTYAEGQKRQKVLNMNLPEVQELLNLRDSDFEIVQQPGFTLWK